MRDLEGGVLQTLCGRPAALIEFIAGTSPETPSPTLGRAAGAAMAKLHAATTDFTQTRKNDLGPEGWAALIDEMGSGLEKIAIGLHAELQQTLETLNAAWPTDLPQGTIHADLFPDNVLFVGETVAGIIDFYFACTDHYAYDLAIAMNAWVPEGQGSARRSVIVKSGALGSWVSSTSIPCSAWVRRHGGPGVNSQAAAGVARRRKARKRMGERVARTMSRAMLETENVQDYPRPPLLEPVPHRIVARAGGAVIVDTVDAWRVCETHHPPTYYFPPEAFRCELLPARGGSLCEWKGQASYWSLKVGDITLPRVAWSYPRPTRAFADIKDFVAIYPTALDSASVAGLAVSAQPGDFYGGWVTENLTGVVKGAPGTLHW
ncbi:MAG: DUF427 domain-containing protein [Pseudomonadota bacterium]